MLPGGLVPRARGRIYVAFGEHPAAGGMYMSFESLWHFVGPGGVSLALWGVALDPLDHFCGKGVKKAPKMDARMETISMTF